jgi:glycosyltransferase involved in cell wall biosynthesis
MTRIVAVVPAYDEEAAIGPVVEEIRAYDPSIDVVVVDDGSSDGTAASAAAAGAAVVRLPFNLGIGAAVQTGFRYALEHGYEVAVRLDGDGQHDPAELPKLLEPLARGEADVVTGSRFRELDGGYRPPIARRSRAPPSAMRTYLRDSARAIDFAIDVLPTPGGPTNSRIGPRPTARAFATTSPLLSLAAPSPPSASSRTPTDSPSSPFPFATV